MTRMKIGLRALLAATAIAAAFPASADVAKPHPPTVEWDTVINHFQVEDDKFVGQRLTVACPELAVTDVAGQVFGTDLYASESSICGAALHAGAVSASGGTVTLQIMPGATAYTGEARHGVISLDRPQTERAIAFVPTTTPDIADVQQKYAPRIDWDTKFTRTGLANRDLLGQSFTFKCPAAPADMRARRVVGTDRYAFDSMICRSAVHAGQIDLAGGFVTLRMEPGSKDLIGSTRNGIETKDGGSVVRTIVFVRD
ncbi:MAG: LCCL domain-containing protein [Pseudomonadota bacterium]